MKRTSKLQKSQRWREKEKQQSSFLTKEEAEDVIYLNNYYIDKMVFKLTRETDDKDVRSIDD